LTDTAIRRPGRNRGHIESPTIVSIGGRIGCEAHRPWQAVENFARAKLDGCSNSGPGAPGRE
jgi:hypothetical protein